MNMNTDCIPAIGYTFDASPMERARKIKRVPMAPKREATPILEIS